jgi:hypothetical protein
MGFHPGGCCLVFILSILLILSFPAASPGVNWPSTDFDCRGLLRRGLPRPDLTRGSHCWHVVRVMSITIQLDLPEAVATKARAKGLLEPGELTRLITREVAAEEDARDFFEMVRHLRLLPGDPMTIEEIQAEVDAVRAEGAARENRC